jgi:methionyl-tRNA synthetase
LRNAVEKLSGDLCISRPKSRLDWGIELPFDKDFVTYVWFDALTNYISFAGYTVGEADSFPYNSQPSTFRDKWPALQIIGKDILVPAHGIYWLIMLHAIGFPDDQMPQLLVHGWWNLGGAKMSKSAGNIVDPFALIEKYGAEALRYYLISEIATGSDADFREGFLVAGYNHALANTMGNLANRTLNMIHRFRHGTIKSIDLTTLAESEVRSHLQAWSNGELKAGQTFYRDKFADFRPSNALSAPLARALACNALVEISAPWNLAKDKQQEKLLDAVLYHLAESLRIIAIWMWPVLPQAAHGIFDQLNWKMELSGKEERFSLADAEWGKLPDGHVVGKPVPLFPRIEVGDGV